MLYWHRSGKICGYHRCAENTEKVEMQFYFKTGEGRSLMRMMTKVFLLAVSVLVLASVPVRADGALGIAVDKTVSSDVRVLVFEGTTYKIFTISNYLITFERVDNTHHRIYIDPIDETLPCYDIYIQWGFFLPVRLDIGSGGTNSYLLGTETGYAEK